MFSPKTFFSETGQVIENINIFLIISWRLKVEAPAH